MGMNLCRGCGLTFGNLTSFEAHRLGSYGEPIYKSLNALGSSRPKAGGRGIQLMRNAFDRVDYYYKPRGTELILTKKLE